MIENRTIHYCWFGRGEKPALVIKCIDSWKRIFPNYSIVEWNEDNFDINCCAYVSEAYSEKKWAFVSDYCRVWALYNYGGIYFDTDVEILKWNKIFEDPLISFENKRILNPGLVLSCNPNDWFCKEMLDSYSKDHFLVNGEHNYLTICDRSTTIFLKCGLKLNNKFQIIKGYNVYPSDFFNPMGFKGGTIKKTTNTIGIHYFSASWQDPNIDKKVKLNVKGKIYYFLQNIFGEKTVARFRAFVKRKK